MALALAGRFRARVRVSSYSAATVSIGFSFIEATSFDSLDVCVLLYAFSSDACRL